MDGPGEGAVGFAGAFELALGFDDAGDFLASTFEDSFPALDRLASAFEGSFPGLDFFTSALDFLAVLLLVVSPRGG